MDSGIFNGNIYEVKATWFARIKAILLIAAANQNFFFKLLYVSVIYTHIQ